MADFGDRRLPDGVNCRVPGGDPPGRCGVRIPAHVGVPVHDALFVLLILAVFGLLALIGKGAEKL